MSVQAVSVHQQLVHLTKMSVHQQLVHLTNINLCENKQVTAEQRSPNTAILHFMLLWQFRVTVAFTRLIIYSAGDARSNAQQLFKQKESVYYIPY